MTERQRTAHPGTPPDQPGEDAAENAGGASHDDVRALADRLMANAQDSLRRLGVGNANEFLNATRQSGGQ